MNWQNRLFRQIKLWAALSTLILLASGCTPEMWRVLHQLDTIETRLHSVEEQTATALQTAAETKALVEKALGEPTTTCPPLPAAGDPPTEAGVALQTTDSAHSAMQLYPLRGLSNIKVYKKDAAASFPASEPLTITSSTILFAVTGTPNTPEAYTLYADNSVAASLGTNPRWYLYAVSTSASITQPVTKIWLGPSLAISATQIFTTPTGSQLTDSLDILKIEAGVDLTLIRRLLLVRQENGQPVYTLIIFEGTGSPAGSNPVCAWCTNCGAPCASFCQAIGCR